MPTVRALAVALLVPHWAACGYTEIHTQCPSCIVFSRQVAPAAVPVGTHTAVILVEGVLGFGWEWDEPLAILRREPATFTEVFEWRPSSSLGRAARDLGERLNQLLVDAPASLETLLVIGHSAGGILTARASAELRVPPGKRVLIVNVGTPYAGMNVMPMDDPRDAWRSPALVAVGGKLSRYPTPARSVTVESWVTHYPPDPVMQPRFGHDPGDPSIGPPGRRATTPPLADHNRVLAPIVETLLKRLRH